MSRQIEARVVFIKINYRDRGFRSALCVEIERFVFDLFEEKLFKLAQVFNAYSKQGLHNYVKLHGLTDIKHQLILIKHCLI